MYIYDDTASPLFICLCLSGCVPLLQGFSHSTWPIFVTALGYQHRYPSWVSSVASVWTKHAHRTWPHRVTNATTTTSCYVMGSPTCPTKVASLPYSLPQARSVSIEDNINCFVWWTRLNTSRYFATIMITEKHRLFLLPSSAAATTTRSHRIAS